jgi:citrate-Mg2+:H+ or citrate-Ca2+:H+ symporter, CitMHS family
VTTPAAIAFAMIGVFVVLLMTRRLSAITALILVPAAFGVMAGFGTDLGTMVVEAIRVLAPTAVMLIFAMLYFMVMTDAGMFDPLASAIVRAVGGDPVKILVGTVGLGFLVALDGDGATVYMIVLSALLPLYQRLGLSIPKVATLLLCCTGLGNMLPWGGPTARAAVSMKADMSDVFGPLVVPLLACVLWTLILAVLFGRSERRRLGVVELATAPARATGSEDAVSVTCPPEREARRWKSDTLALPHLVFNWLLTAGLITLLVAAILPMPLVFMIAAAVALVVNFPNLKAQSDQIAAHAPAILAVASLIFAASVFTGVLSGTGMAPAMASAIIHVIPQSVGPYLALVTALLSIPVTWVVSNDVFYFGMLPVLAEAASGYGITSAEMARASLVGQPVHILSPLVASTYLLVGMLNLDYARTQRSTLPVAAITCLVMLGTALVLGVIPLAR